MTTVSYTLNELLNQAVDDLPRPRRGFTQLALAFDPVRASTLEKLRVGLANPDDARASALGLAEALTSPSFDVFNTQIQIDVDKLREILELILEFLPLFLDFFGMSRRGRRVAVGVFALIMAVGMSESTLAADNEGKTSQCHGGACVIPAAKPADVPSTSKLVGHTSPVVTLDQPNVMADPIEFVPAPVFIHTVPVQRTTAEVIIFEEAGESLPTAAASRMRQPLVNATKAIGGRVVNISRKLGQRIRTFRQNYGILPRIRARCN